MPTGLPFPTGTVVMKILTTSAPPECVPFLKGSPEWQIDRHKVDPEDKRISVLARGADFARSAGGRGGSRSKVAHALGLWDLHLRWQSPRQYFLGSPRAAGNPIRSTLDFPCCAGDFKHPRAANCAESRRENVSALRLRKAAGRSGGQCSVLLHVLPRQRIRSATRSAFGHGPQRSALVRI